MEEVHIVPETQQSEAHSNSDQQEPPQTEPLSSFLSLPSPSSPPPHQVEAEIPKASPSSDLSAAADPFFPPAEPSADLHTDTNTNMDVGSDSGNAPEPASPTSHTSLESSSRWVQPRHWIKWEGGGGGWFD